MAFDGFSWFVGIFEGEGSIAIGSRLSNRAITLSVSSTDHDVLVAVRRVIGHGYINGPYDNHKRDGVSRKQIYQWRLSKREHLEPLLIALLPHVGVRRAARIRKALGEYRRRPGWAPPSGADCGYRSKVEPSCSGARKHYKNKEVPCSRCRAQQAARERADRARTRNPRGVK